MCTNKVISYASIPQRERRLYQPSWASHTQIALKKNTRWYSRWLVCGGWRETSTGYGAPQWARKKVGSKWSGPYQTVTLFSQSLSVLLLQSVMFPRHRQLISRQLPHLPASCYLTDMIPSQKTSKHKPGSLSRGAGLAEWAVTWLGCLRGSLWKEWTGNLSLPSCLLRLHVCSRSLAHFCPQLIPGRKLPGDSNRPSVKKHSWAYNPPHRRAKWKLKSRGFNWEVCSVRIQEWGTTTEGMFPGRRVSDSNIWLNLISWRLASFLSPSTTNVHVTWNRWLCFE